MRMFVDTLFDGNINFMPQIENFPSLDTDEFLVTTPPILEGLIYSCLLPC